MRSALLALEDGSLFEGEAIGITEQAVGEVVFNTAMTGCQEILSDPSYARQIVTLTYPHIGNTGVNAEDEESAAVHAAGLVVRDLPKVHSNWRAQSSLGEYLKARRVVAIADIDTRRLTRLLRERGSQNGCIMAGSLDEAAALVYISVFSGGFAVVDAEAIFARDFSEKSVPELLTLLLDKSLIRRVVNESWSNDRYEMLATIQEYALERLRDFGEETEIRDRHLAYFSEVAKQAGRYLRSADQLEWLDRLDAEYDNIRAALSWAQASGSIVTGLQLGTDLEMFWIYRAYLRETLFCARKPTRSLLTK